MCIPGLDPMSLLGLAGSVGGSLINAQIQRQAIDEQNRQNRTAMERERTARTQEVDRQRQWESSQAEEVTRALGDASPQTIARETERQVEEPENRILAAADQYNVPTLQGQVQNQDVDIGGIVSGQAARTRDLLRAAATLQGQASSFNNAGQGLFDMSGMLANLGSERRGSMNASRLETSVPAAEVTPSHSPIGDLLMLGGQALAGRGGQSAGARGISAYRPGSTIGQPLSAIRWLR
jgi:hypothetical protein